MAGAAKNRAPAADEFELSIFGPGYGESIALHVGGGRWLLVDSCIDRASKRPAVLDYFDEISANPADCVDLVVATHWHDDHVRGISTVFETCRRAEFACSSALTQPEFLELTQVYSSLGDDAGIAEMRKVIACLQDRATATPASRQAPKLAVADRLVHRWTGASKSAGAELIALSPSDTAKLLAQAEIAKMLPEPWTLRTRARTLTPNLASVALWLRAGEITVLLGSDLEEMGDPRMGWTAIVDSTTRPEGSALVFKVPHHGAESAHHDDVWSQMVDASAVSAMTPFAKGRTRLPSASDRARILSLRDDCYISADPMPGRRVKRPKKVADLIGRTVRSIEVLHQEMGHIRLRAKLDGSSGSPTVELFRGAKHLSAAA